MMPKTIAARKTKAAPVRSMFKDRINVISTSVGIDGIVQNVRKLARKFVAAMQYTSCNLPFANHLKY